jgi:hypothetical protein
MMRPRRDGRVTGPGRPGPRGRGWSLVAASAVLVGASVVPFASVTLVSALVLPGAATRGHLAQVVDDPERRPGARLAAVPDGAAQVDGNPADADAEPRRLEPARVGVPALPRPISCGIPIPCSGAGVGAASAGPGCGVGGAGAGAACWATAGAARSARQAAGKRRVARIGFSGSGHHGRVPACSRPAGTPADVPADVERVALRAIGPRRERARVDANSPARNASLGSFGTRRLRRPRPRRRLGPRYLAMIAPGLPHRRPAPRWRPARRSPAPRPG